MTWPSGGRGHRGDADVTYLVACAGEPPPAWVREQGMAAGVTFEALSGEEATEQLAALVPRGYVMNSFGAQEGPCATIELLDRVPTLDVVTYMGASRELEDYRDYIDLDALRERGIAFTSTATPEGNHPVAEGAVTLLLALELNLVDVHRSGVRPGTRTGLSGSTFGVVGMGQVGRRVTALASALGMKTVYHSRSRHPEVEERFGARSLALEDMAAHADHLSIHLPNSAPRGLIDAAVLAHANGLNLVNTTSAPGLVDPEALLDGLRVGRVARAAIEGTYPEPYDTQLRQMGAGRVVMLPAYTSWDTYGARDIGWQNVLDTYSAAAADRPLPHRLL